MSRPKIIIIEGPKAKHRKWPSSLPEADVNRSYTGQESNNQEEQFSRLLKSVSSAGRLQKQFQVIEPDTEPAEVLLLEDTCCLTEGLTNTTVLIRKTRAKLLIYHMTDSSNGSKNGDSLWELSRKGPFVKDEYNQDRDRFIVVVTADDLRARGVKLSRGLSWEKTCEEFVGKLGSVGSLVTMITCANLVVLYDCDGVIYHRGSNADQPVLFFDAQSSEGEFSRRRLRESGLQPRTAEAFLIGFSGKIAETVASVAVNSDGISAAVEEGIISGLCVSRHLVNAELKNPQSWSDSTMGHKSISKFIIPSDELSSGVNPYWSIIEHTFGNNAEAARQIVRKGVNSPSIHVPSARVKDLILVDRREIESLRAISKLVQNSITAPNAIKRPINVAIFGPRGCGKSFAASQIVEWLKDSAFTPESNKPIQHITFNFRCMTHEHALTALRATHKQSQENGGALTVVHFCGFDVAPVSSSSSSSLLSRDWVPFMLRSIFGGGFWHQDQTPPEGPTVFLFEMTGYRTMEEFRSHQNIVSSNDTSLALEADVLLSYFHGYIDMLGPDCSPRADDSCDDLYLVRRAVILRRLLEQEAPRLISETGELRIDDSVLDGLLLTPQLRQGVRSLKSVIEMSDIKETDCFRRFHLPEENQLGLHIDYTAFERNMNGHVLSDDVREILAEKLNGVYLQQRYRTASSEAEYDSIHEMEWTYLDEERRESSRIHADSLPRKLRLVSCYLSKTQPHLEDAAVEEFDADEIEFLARVEHDRWNSERMQKQWRLGERKPEERRTPFLVPWNELAENVRDMDRVMVASYPKILPYGYSIYRLGGGRVGNNVKTG